MCAERDYFFVCADRDRDGDRDEDGGGGGGGASDTGDYVAKDGGDGVVILQAPSGAVFSVAPGTNTIQSAPGGEQYATFTVSGTLTVG